MEIPEQILDRAQIAYQEAMLELFSGLSNWKSIKETPSMSALRKKSQSGFDLFKLKAVLYNKKPQEVIDFLFENLSLMNAEVNRDYIKISREVRRFEGCKVVYDVADASVPGVKQRENLYSVMKLDLGEGNSAMIQNSVEDEEVPVADGCLRMDLKYNLHVVETIPCTEHCQLQVIGLIDPKGEIPKFLVNLGLKCRVKIYKEVFKRLK